MQIVNVGDSVKNPRIPAWGTGVVRKLSSEKAHVFFPELQTEKQVLIQNLEIIAPSVPVDMHSKIDELLTQKLPEYFSIREHTFVFEHSWRGWIIKAPNEDSCFSFLDDNVRTLSALNCRLFWGYLGTQSPNELYAIPNCPIREIIEFAKPGVPWIDDRQQRWDASGRAVLFGLLEVMKIWPFELTRVCDEDFRGQFIPQLTKLDVAREIRQALPKCSLDDSDDRLLARDILDDSEFRMCWWD